MGEDEPGVLTFDLGVPAANDFDLELFGSDAAYIKGSYRDTGLAENITHNATVTGTYYVRVYGYPVGNGSYNTQEPYTLGGNFSAGTVTIVTPPQDRSVIEGASASLSVVAGGAQPLGYRWQRDGVDIPGANMSSYVTPSLTLADSGAQFRVIVTNAFGAITSSWATLTVNAGNVITWNGGNSSDWNRTNNWLPQVIPTASDIVVIESGWVFPPPDAAFAVLNLRGGVLEGNFTNTGTIIWSAGILGRGSFTVAPEGVLEISGASGKTVWGGTMRNAGTILFTGTGSVGQSDSDNSTVWDIAPGGLMEVRADGGLDGSRFAINNRGLFRKSGGGGSFAFRQVSFTNSGVAEILSGAMTFTNASAENIGEIMVTPNAKIQCVDSSLLAHPGARITGEGVVEFPSGWNSLYGQIQAPNLRLSGGIVRGIFTNLGTIIWSEGIFWGNVTVAPEGVLEIAGTSGKTVWGGTLSNAGTILITGTGHVGQGDLNQTTFWINAPGGLLDMRTDGGFDGGRFSINNHGLLRKSAGGGGFALIQTFFTNAGVTEVLSGAVTFTNTIAENYGEITVASSARIQFVDSSLVAHPGSHFDGEGIIEFPSGWNYLYGQVQAPNLRLTGGYVGGVFTNLGTMIWSEGTLGRGSFTIAPGGVLEVSGANSKNVWGGTLSNAGTILFTGTGRVVQSEMNNATFWENAPGGIVDVRADGGFEWGRFSLNNRGLFRKSAGDGSFAFRQAFFTNSGLVEVLSGAVTFTNAIAENYGEITVAPAARIQYVDTSLVAHFNSRFSGGGACEFASGWNYVYGHVQGPNLRLSGGIVAGIFTNLGTIIWTEGGLHGAFTIAPEGVLEISGASGKVVWGGTLSNAGTILFTGTGRIQQSDMNNPTVWANLARGVFDVRADGGWDGPISFNNQGLFQKSGGAGTFSLPNTTAFDNAGTVEVQSGTLCFNNGLFQSAGETRLTGGSLSGGYFNFTGGILSGAGTINGLVYNSAIISPGASPGAITINGNYTQTAAGVLQMELGGLTPGSDFDRIVVNGQATLAGALQVSLLPSFTPTPGNTFEMLTCQSRSGIFDSSNAGTLGLIESYTTTNLVLTASDRRQKWTPLFGPRNAEIKLGFQAAPGLVCLFRCSAFHPRTPEVPASSPE